MSGMRARLSKDAAALALGADAVAAALTEAAEKSQIALELTRTGSRGMIWLEPLLELETKFGWVCYGPMGAGDVASVLKAAREGASHPLAHGPAEEIAFFKQQTRLSFARCGVVDPDSLQSYVQAGGLAGLRRALDIGPAGILEQVTQSGLRGRGGAGFPTGIKWRGAAEANGAAKYVVCNADEGDSGTFADRMLMEGDPFLLIEGMVIAGLAIGAQYGYIYVRSEYPHAIATLQRALEEARAHALLGDKVLGTPFAFDLEVRTGAGSYVCGEETALLDSIEGKRGLVRAKPPLPVHVGLFGAPTVINNVLTFAAVPTIVEQGGAFYADFGMGKSRGTMPVQLAGDIQFGGLFETAFGPTLGELVDGIGGGTRSGRPVRAVQVGGPLGAYFPRDLFDTKFDYEDFTAKGGLIGHGGIVVFNDSVDMAAQARFAMEFCAVESCGKCTPCRVGSVRGQELLDRIRAGRDGAADIAQLRELCDIMKSGSLCALGGFVPYPVLSALDHFPQDFVGNKVAS